MRYFVNAKTGKRLTGRDAKIADERFPRQGKNRCTGCGHPKGRHQGMEGCTTYLLDGSGWCDCARYGMRRKKKSGGSDERRSPKREPSGLRFCGHGVPASGSCAAEGCWNNDTPERDKRPILRIPLLRKIVDDAAEEIKRERAKTRRKRTKVEQKRKPKPEPKPLTGRAPRALDDEIV